MLYAWIEHHFNPQLKSNNYNELKSDSSVLPIIVISNEFKIQGTWMLGFVLTVVHWFPVHKIKIIKLSSTYRERKECELLKYYCDEHAAKDHEKKWTVTLIQALSIRIKRINICHISPDIIHSLQWKGRFLLKKYHGVIKDPGTKDVEDVKSSWPCNFLIHIWFWDTTMQCVNSSSREEAIRDELWCTKVQMSSQRQTLRAETSHAGVQELIWSHCGFSLQK